ncbi:MAG: hypothetical protein JNK73_09795 [Bacteroidia bacterium]|nr:hypothetical protein [Bacteroidia bacterium]
MNSKGFLCLIVVSLCFLQCKKDNSNYQGYFYSKVPGDDAQLTLYLDGHIQGLLPFVKTDSIGFTADSIKKYALKLNVQEGKHKLEAKDQNGLTRSSGSFKVTKNKTSSSGNIGGHELILENGELRVGIYF